MAFLIYLTGVELSLMNDIAHVGGCIVAGGRHCLNYRFARSFYHEFKSHYFAR